MYPAKNKSYFIKEGTEYWEVTGSLCPNRHFDFWSSAVPLFHVVSVLLANDLVIQASRASIFSQRIKHKISVFQINNYNKNYHLLRTCYVLGIIRRALHILKHLILATTLCGQYHD